MRTASSSSCPAKALVKSMLLFYPPALFFFLTMLLVFQVLTSHEIINITLILYYFSNIRFKEKSYGSSGATSGLTSSLAFTPVQVN